MNELSVITWNIWSKGGSLRRPRHWVCAADLLALQAADLIGLQEVDRCFSSRTDHADVAAEMAHRLGFEMAFSASIELPAPRGQYRAYGNALLSRFPIVSQRAHRLSPQIRWEPNDRCTEPRSALEAVLSVEGEPLRVVVTHLGVEGPNGSNQVRRQQVQHLLRILRSSSLPTVLMGDFNCAPDSDELRCLQEWMTSASPCDRPTTVKDFEADRGYTRPRTLDYILLSPGLVAARGQVLESDLSDHLPVGITLSV